MPSWISWATRPSSFEVGSAPSLTTLASAELKAWPALSDAARVISVSGSCASNVFRRLRAMNLTNSDGSRMPAASGSSSRKPFRPSTKRPNTPRIRAAPIWM